MRNKFLNPAVISALTPLAIVLLVILIFIYVANSK
jgi:hypothetical protein